jgi:P2 family phage contractile tail tube protein
MAFKLTAFDPQVMRLFGLAPGVMKEFMATGALVDEDGTTHSAVAYVRGYIMEAKADNWKPGDKKTENDFKVSVRYYKLEIDGEQVIEMDPFGVTIGGVSQTDNIRRALLI